MFCGFCVIIEGKIKKAVIRISFEPGRGETTAESGKRAVFLAKKENLEKNLSIG